MKGIFLTQAEVGNSANCADRHDDCKWVNQVGNLCPRLLVIVIHKKLIFTGIEVVILCILQGYIPSDNGARVEPVTDLTVILPSPNGYT